VTWRGYFVVERGAIGAGNWASLQWLYERMGTRGSSFPMWNNHQRARLDGDAMIYEFKFEPGEVSVASFKELLANEFSIPIEDIDHTQDVVSYSGSVDTMVWEFLYNDLVRFTVRRFGRGGTWAESKTEALAYLQDDQAAWEPKE
jgi:hypothetical protein